MTPTHTITHTHVCNFIYIYICIYIILLCVSYENYKNNLWIENEVPCLIRFLLCSIHTQKQIHTNTNTYMDAQHCTKRQRHRHRYIHRHRHTHRCRHTDTDLQYASFLLTVLTSQVEGTDAK